MSKTYRILTQSRARPVLLGLAVLVALLLGLAAAQPTQASSSSNIVSLTAVSVGALHACALTEAGGIVCWGRNVAGQLGNGNFFNSTKAPFAVTGLAGSASAISAGGNHTCALTEAGGIVCWGHNVFGQLGNGDAPNSSFPVAVTGLTSGVAAISAGGAHTCALTEAGSVLCWGANGDGRLGNGSTTNSNVPVAVAGLVGGVTAISAGESHTCALTEAGGVLCWGANFAGQLGDGSTTNSSVPISVTGLTSGVTAISAGGSHTCALTEAGGVLCWGANSAGQLGDGSSTNSNVPIAVAGLASGVTAVGTGGSHTCGLTEAGGVLCWGSNGFGQLGDGSNASTNVPVAVTELTGGVAAVSADSDQTCGLTEAGGVLCWGFNRFGQLGSGSTANSNVPAPLVFDVTPPVITPIIQGTLGLNGWYTSTVVISWNVVEPESILLPLGCPGRTINADTPSLTQTCNSGSAGGMNQLSVTIKRDATLPTLNPTLSHDPIRLGQLASAVANAADNLSGIAAASCAPLDTASVGTRTASCTATDTAGNTASAVVTYTVKADTTASLTVAPNPAALGQAVTLRASISTAVAGITPSGSVTFRDGTTPLQTVTLDASGQASFTTTALALGPHALSASYSGDSNFQPSVAPIVTLTVGPPFPQTGILDNFNRANGRVGAKWTGLTSLLSYAIDRKQLVVRLGGPLIWHQGAALGINQEAFVTLSKIDSRGHEQGLLLKVGGDKAPDWTLGAIQVVYDAKRQQVRVGTFRAQRGQRDWTPYPGLAAVYKSGDQLGARVLGSGEVRIYRNGQPIGSVQLNAADTSYFATRGGRIGLWNVKASKAVLDDFGGGAVTP